MLVSLTITIMMMLAVVTLFQVMTDSVSGSRALLETADRLRACRNRLQADLQGATATMNPPLRPESDEGYFEIIEGINNDANYGGMTRNGASLYGDVDDYLAFTVRSRGEPFVGKLAGAAAESQIAEVLYFLAPSVDASLNPNGTIMDATQSPPTRLFTLYRRVLLVYPVMGTQTSSTNFYDNNDISVRLQEVLPVPLGGRTFNVVQNTLGDLTKRENRFSHYGYATTFPSPFPFTLFVPTTALPKPTGWPTSTVNLVTSNQFLAPMTAPRLGDDVILTNVLAFDVQAFDPGAPIYLSGGVAVEPRDAGFASMTGASSAYGAYADLGWTPPSGFTPSPGNPPLFNGAPSTRSGITTRPYIYDTWSLHYENDGVLQLSPTGIADAGTNGLDDDSNGIVDDLPEYDTLPPYPAKLRGVRITVRVYEPSSQQVREITVVQDFLAE